MQRTCWYEHKPMTLDRSQCCCKQPLQSPSCDACCKVIAFFCFAFPKLNCQADSCPQHCNGYQRSSSTLCGMQGLPSLHAWTQKHVLEQHSPPGPTEVLISNGSNHAIEVSVGHCLLTFSCRPLINLNSDVEPTSLCKPPACAVCTASQVLLMYGWHSNAKPLHMQQPLLLIYYACKMIATLIACCRW